MRYTTIQLILFFFITTGFVACNNGSTVDTLPADSYIKYQESAEDFVNPERGFYRYSDTRADNYQKLSVNTLKGYREESKSSGASYETYNSLVFRYFVLNGFQNSSISNDYLQNVEADFAAAREAGVSLIPRFTYTTSAVAGNCPEDFICPPYGDASKEIVLQHIDQLAPILSENADVILTVQMGFIGTWGENYYTDFFGDASSNADQGKLLDDNWQDRIEVLKFLLDQLPPEVQVQVRYPQMKQRAVYGIDAKTNVAPLSEEEAFLDTYKARIGHHNDCLFASPSDFGTYEDYGNSSSPRRTDITTLKAYFAEDSKFTVVGGETCSDGYSPYNDCAPAGKADEDLRLLHYTYLNTDYNNQVNNDWVDGGCMEAIKRNLGYRIVLDSIKAPNQIEVNNEASFTFYIRNIGYAAPVKYRPVYLIFENKDTSDEFRLLLDTDLRFWNNEVVLDQSFDIADDVVPGEYEISLFIPAQYESIADRPEYAIRLANDNMWQSISGYNSLNHTVKIIN